MSIPLLKLLNLTPRWPETKMEGANLKPISNLYIPATLDKFVDQTIHAGRDVVSNDASLGQLVAGLRPWLWR